MRKRSYNSSLLLLSRCVYRLFIHNSFLIESIITLPTYADYVLLFLWKTYFFFSRSWVLFFVSLFYSLKELYLVVIAQLDLVEGHMQRVYYNVNSVSIVSSTSKHTWTYIESIERIWFVSELAVMWMDASSGCIGCETNASECSRQFPDNKLHNQGTFPPKTCSAIVYCIGGGLVRASAILSYPFEYNLYFRLRVWSLKASLISNYL